MSEQRDWKERALEATGGLKNPIRSQLGAILSAMLLRNRPGQYPCFSSNAVITSDGFVMAGYVDRHGIPRGTALVCDVDDLVGNFRGLADYLKLDDKERRELFDALRKWIETDYRARVSKDDPLNKDVRQ